MKTPGFATGQGKVGSGGIEEVHARKLSKRVENGRKWSKMVANCSCPLMCQGRRGEEARGGRDKRGRDLWSNACRTASATALGARVR